MRDWKAVCKKLLAPPVWLMILLIPVSAAALAVVFLKGWEETVPAYVIYVLAFYTLTVTVLYCVGVFPGCYRTVKRKIYKTKFGGRYMTDAVFKTHVSLYRSLVINLLYVALNVVSGFVYKSVWFMILAVYYTVLSVMRFLLVHFVRNAGIGQNRLGELCRSRLCAKILMLVNVALPGAVMMMMYQGRGAEYAGILIYVMAVYTFYITITAVIDLFRHQKYRSPVMSVTKVIDLAAALVSMLNLETAMFAAFGGGMTVENRRLMIALTGAGVSAAVIVLAAYTVGRTTREIRALNADK